MARLMRALGETVGDGIEIMVDFHGHPASACAALAHIEALAPGRPLFVEEPLPPSWTAALAALKAETAVPQATERLVDRAEFEPILHARAIDIIQLDLCHVGGLGESRKIADVA